VAAVEAWQDAFGNGSPTEDAARIAVVLGAGLICGTEPPFADGGAWRVSGPTADEYDLRTLERGDGALEMLTALSGAGGPRWEVNSACAAAGHAVGLGRLLIATGRSDVVLVVGADAMLHPLGVAGFLRLGVVSTRRSDGARACRPFDSRRDGTVVAEGAAALVLEAVERTAGRPTWGFVAGFGASADGHSVTAPHPDGAGARRAMVAALRSARRRPDEIQYLNVHGTGTRLNDLAEADAIREVFAGCLPGLWCSATKPMTGHLIAAAGAAEAVITLLTINTGVVFPTLNLDHPDPHIGLDLVPRVARRRVVECAMSNAFGLGGQTSSVVLSAPPVRRSVGGG
jgi:3-oxoacyl-[acyl-carrier-protein] synthase II